MRFTIHTLGGKLISVAALTLLLCLLLFSGISWYLIQFIAEREARSDASTHLSFLHKSYQDYTSTIQQNLSQVGNDPDLKATLTQPATISTRTHLEMLLGRVPAHYHLYHLSRLYIVSGSYQLLASLDQGSIQNNSTPTNVASIIAPALQGKVTTLIEKASSDGSQSTGSSAAWLRNTVVPIYTAQGQVRAVLVAEEPVDDDFARELIKNTGITMLVCVSRQVVGTTLTKNAADDLQGQQDICTPDQPHTWDGATQYYTVGSSVQTAQQGPGAPSLSLVAVEPRYNLNGQTERFFGLQIAVGILVFAVGVIIYTFVARRFFIQPLRQLQSRVQSLVPESEVAVVNSRITDELRMLDRSFNLLSTSLQLRESESMAITRQMTDLLIMSDALISTLNLEKLLEKIVSHLANLMHVKNVSLLLYGREMNSPWAVANWAEQPSDPRLPVASAMAQPGIVTVHADPDGDITLAVTTKMAALPNPIRPSNHNSGKRAAVRAIRAPKLTHVEMPSGLRKTPRIPRPALRDLDMILSRMAIQKKKIVYGEDVQTINQQRREVWSQMALDAGYRSVIAVPLMLQEQAIGAFVLYDDRAREVTNRETFLLSTAAIHAAMAIQNALLFAEVKDKNAELERVNHLKSQFLATVTHELRTPLHSIISYGALILEGFVEGELTAEQEEHIQFMVRRAEDLSHLVDDMLDLSKIEADRLEVKVEPLDLSLSLKDVVNQLKPMANNKGLYLNLEMEEGLPQVMADSHRIRQIVINLVSNALKFTEKGGVTIRCSRLEGYEMQRVSVHDTGIGISPAALEYIFEAFRQADGSTTRRFGGTGLGLTIARKLIELQGGEVTVESTVGQGSTFSFTLPAVPSTRTGQSRLTGSNRR